MRVIHISTSSTGGAGTAAKRLHSELINSGVESHFITLTKQDYSFKNKIEITRSIKERTWSFLSSRFHARISQKIFFSSWSISVSKAIDAINRLQSEETIFHIHNWYNILSFEDIATLIKSGFKIVFTMHDERIFTGGCHYAFSCPGFKSNCDNCPQIPRIFSTITVKNLELQRKTFYGAQNIRFIAPSNWIAHELRSGHQIEQGLIKHISNIHPSIANSNIKKFKKDERLTFGVASVHPYSQIKGGTFIREFEKYVNETHEKIRIIFLKDLPKDRGPEFWGQIDFLLVPSIVDNSPNVVHEAKMMGIPVVATRVGGITEMLDEPFDLVVNPEERDFDSVISHCKKLLLDTTFRIQANEMMEKYAKYVGNPIKEHIKVYQDLLDWK